MGTVGFSGSAVGRVLVLEWVTAGSILIKRLVGSFFRTKRRSQGRLVAFGGVMASVLGFCVCRCRLSLS